MPIEVTFVSTSSGKSPDEVIQDLIHSALPTEAGMLRAGTAQVGRIKTRTEIGVDVNGNEFAPYKSSTAKSRQKKGLQTEPVNLRSSGDLLDSMSVEVRGSDTFAIGVPEEQVVIGKALNEGTANMPARRFFDTSDAELTQMSEELFQE